METDVITIDGPTSSGKNSVGFLLAKKLGYQYIDTGMIYRAGAYLILQNNISLDNKEDIVNTFKSLRLEIKSDNGSLRIYNNGRDLTDKLHLSEVTENVSIVAAIKEVREVTKVIQRKLGESKNTVMTGRDIGSEIFPNAKHKFFLTASAEIRVKRRFKQLIKVDPAITYEMVYKSMLERDEKDSTREVSPLRIPKGAVVIDNSNLNVEQTVEEMLKHIQQKLFI
ncbi:cytidylate kinase [Candidatus Daviesbacteria bacterium RIFCSPHIGHO2_02_FULL_39_12]|uniref:Cytidylate kinase n=2 Tax=Candidatus Daviesiibacteriota TaxID=1752718 RepID=A0A1F5JE05_9BACT|nr:MAG: cytidylate kinase [Candidatus Daviesbacteria bacterium RIFCSPHIGHO2_02_FULL_39_12]OGE71908.1 MAG: cytidylate kinase [Candidatus Daviesbacteria bacterium RIFCSPLOWO2_02_FULL_38_15]